MYGLVSLSTISNGRRRLSRWTVESAYLRVAARRSCEKDRECAPAVRRAAFGGRRGGGASGVRGTGWSGGRAAAGYALAADEALGVVDGVGRVERSLVLRGLANQALGVGESNDGRRDAVTLVVGDDLDTAIYVDADALRREPRVEFGARPQRCCDAARARGASRRPAGLLVNGSKRVR